MATVLVAQRDASWYDHPNVRTMKKLHRVVDGMAGCNRHVPLDLATWVADMAPRGLLCRRRGCFTISPRGLSEAHSTDT